MGVEQIMLVGVEQMAWRLVGIEEMLGTCQSYHNAL